MPCQPRCETRPHGNLFARYYEAGDSTCSGTLKHVEEGVRASYLWPFINSDGCSDFTLFRGEPYSIKSSCSADGSTALQTEYGTSDCSGLPLGPPGRRAWEADPDCHCINDNYSRERAPWARYVAKAHVVHHESPSLRTFHKPGIALSMIVTPKSTLH